MRLAEEAAGAFKARHQRAPTFVVHSPGRVNLIGEHTDYSLLPVLPVAIDRGITVAAAPSTSFEIFSTLSGVQAYTGRASDGWHRYIEGARKTSPPSGDIAAVVTSDLPATGGLSSSTALTMAIIGAFRLLDGRPWDPALIAADAVRGERVAGIESGTMDQTVIAHAMAGTALRIDFTNEGATWHSVTLPEQMDIVVAYSGQPAEKGAGARDAYNSRVIACRLATVLLAAELGIAPSTPPVLADVYATVDQTLIADLPTYATVAAVASGTGVDASSLSGLTAETFPLNQEVPLRESARHVLEEARRVNEAERAMLAGDLSRLGAILNESHESLIRFGASTPALDRLVEAMRKAGAIGSRLTGAGFGGNAVAIAPPDRVEDIKAAAARATGGPAFEVRAAPGLSWTAVGPKSGNSLLDA